MKTRIQNLIVALALLASIHQAAAQGTTAFTYQGQLRDGGTNANGAYTMIFKLYDASTNGDQIGNAITNGLTLVNGLFTVNLDFGAIPFNGSARWLDITVTSGSDTQTLPPRVAITPAPYALYALSAGGQTNSSSNGGTVTATNLVLGGGGSSWDFGINSAGALALTYGDPLTTITVGTDGTLSGNGAGLTNVSAVPNIQVFDSSGTFTVPPGVTRIMVEIWGGGGGGTSVDINLDSGGGGGGGGYGKQVFAVTPGSNHAVVVGLAGNPDSSGGDSVFDGIITAHGGQYTAFGGIGGSCNATLNIEGGDGAPVSGGYSGHGGAAGCGGLGGTCDGYSVNGFIPPGNGSVPGGGGGGGDYNSDTLTTIAPGYGAHGRVVIYY